MLHLNKPNLSEERCRALLSSVTRKAQLSLSLLFFSLDSSFLTPCGQASAKSHRDTAHSRVCLIYYLLCELSGSLNQLAVSKANSYDTVSTFNFFG